MSKGLTRQNEKEKDPKTKFGGKEEERYGKSYAESYLRGGITG